MADLMKTNSSFIRGSSSARNDSKCRPYVVSSIVRVRANQTLDHPSSVCFHGTKQLQRPSVIETNGIPSCLAPLTFRTDAPRHLRTGKPLETSQEFQPTETQSTILFFPPSSVRKPAPTLSFQSSLFPSFCFSSLPSLFRSFIDCRTMDSFHEWVLLSSPLLPGENASASNTSGKKIDVYYALI